MKKTWDKPELIVLLRSKPEEAVLAACKGGTVAGPGTVGPHSGCRAATCHGCAPNAPCAAFSAS